jgi:hypothetical protein
LLEAGGGVLIAPGDRTDPEAWNGLGWLPAVLGDRVGRFAARKSVAHPSLSTFSGPVFSPFARGDASPLAEAKLFGYRALEPTTGAFVSARLDTGAPWAVERPIGRGRVLMLAGPLDAEGGTLPVNPDFVPLLHEWIIHLAGGSAPRPVHPGESLVFDVTPPPSDAVESLSILTPSGETARTVVTREGSRSSGAAKARFDDTAEPGVYRLAQPDPPGGFLYAIVEGNARGSDATELDRVEISKLSAGWPLAFSTDFDDFSTRLLATGPVGRQELWRGLVLAALGGLCVEVYLTRRLVRGQGLKEVE